MTARRLTQAQDAKILQALTGHSYGGPVFNGLNVAQRVPFFDDARHKLVMGGERSGKSFQGGLYGTCRSFDPGTRLIWIVGPDYSLARPEFGYIIDMAQTLGTYVAHNSPRSSDEPSYVDVSLCGGKDRCRLDHPHVVHIETKTARDPRKLAGQAPDGIIGCEVALWDYETFLRVMGRLSERRGWSWMSGSFESSLHWAAEIWTKWQGANNDGGRSFSLPTHTNIAIFPQGADDPEIIAKKMLYPHHRFVERFMGEPCPPAGLVFNEFDTALYVRALELNPNKEVYLGIDPGWSGAYSVVAVQMGDDNTVYCIDELYAQNMTHDEVIRECQTRPWWSQVRHGAIDIAGSQHHAQESAMEAWRRVGGVYLSAEKIGVTDGIMRVYSFIRPGKLIVDPKCRGLLCEFGSGPPPFDGAGTYRYRTNHDGVVVSDTPIDANNHSSKALAYLLIDLFGYVETKETNRPMSYLQPLRNENTVSSFFSRSPSAAQSYLK